MNNILIHKGLGVKLKPEFLQMCKATEKQFAKLISNNTIDIGFVDFLHERYYIVKDMGEKTFTNYIINFKLEIYPNFIWCC